MEFGAIVGVDGLQSCAVVNMSYSGNCGPWLVDDLQHVSVLFPKGAPVERLPQLLAHRRNHKHVWALTLEVKKLADTIMQNRWREWPEAFPVLNLEIHGGLHLEATGVTHDRAGSKCTRPKLHASQK